MEKSEKIIPLPPEGFVIDGENNISNLSKLPEGFVLEKNNIQETAKQKIGRNTARSFARAAESVLGLPGDILSLPKKLLPEPLKKAPIFGLNLPSSDELKDLNQKIFGNILKPQSEGEEFSDEIVSDAASLLLPIKGKIPFLRAIGTSIFTNSASKGIEALGGSKDAQTAIKLGAFFLSGLTGKGSVKKFWTKKYDEAIKNIPSGDKFNAVKLQNDLNSLGKELIKGISTPSKSNVLKSVNEIKNKIKKGKLPVEEAVEIKRNINELRESLFDEIKNKTARQGAKVKFNEVSKYLDDSLREYGKTNPAFYKPYEIAQEAYGGFQQSKKVGNFISKILGKSKVSPTTALLIKQVFFPSNILSTAASAGAGYGVLKTGELITRFFKNKTLNKYYIDLIKNAIKENSAGTIKNINKINKEIENEDYR